MTHKELIQANIESLKVELDEISDRSDPIDQKEAARLLIGILAIVERMNKST